MKFFEDPRFPALVAAILGMIAGVTAKQAVSIQAGIIPKWSAIFADILVLGMVLIIVMYIFSRAPEMPMEAVALMAAGLAMWGPKGIAALLDRAKGAALKGVESMARAVIEPVEPVHRPTVVEEGKVLRTDGEYAEQEDTQFIPTEKTAALTAPLRKLRDKLPLQDDLPREHIELLRRADEHDANTGGQDD